MERELTEKYVNHVMENGGEAAIAKAGELIGASPESLKAAWKTMKEGDKVLLDPADPLEAVNVYIKMNHSLGDVEARLIQYSQGQFYRWRGSHYELLAADQIRSQLYDLLKDAVTQTGKEEYVPFKPNTHKVNNIVDALKAACCLSADFQPPCWIDKDVNPDRPASSEYLPCRNGLLHLPTDVFTVNTPAFFCTNSIDYDYDPKAEDPTRWLEFLDQIWSNDPSAIMTLQRWFGYCLTSDARLQKGLLLIGPKRSGKGTIARVMSKALGQHNVAGISLNSLTGQFGLSSLVDKNLAIISDARLSGRSDMAVIVERLLNIIGQDTQAIGRKWLETIYRTLPTKIMMMTNELPRFNDASTALADRFIVLTMQNSFTDRIDPTLTDKLLTELPRILKWAIDGWKDLWEIGRFQQPDSSEETVRELIGLTSPISMFIEDCCEIGNEFECDASELYQSWCDWCEDQGRNYPGTKQMFGRDLHSVLPQIVKTRPRIKGGRSYTYKGVRPTGCQPGTGRETTGKIEDWGEV
jgi:putative DNA primase/helicase